jgi:hypothetical protein
MVGARKALKRDEIRFGQSGDGGGSLSHWERVGVRGYGLSSEQRPLTRIANAIRPLPAGER